MLKNFAAMNLNNIIIAAAYGRHVETEEERVAAVKQKFQCTMRLLKCTLLYFDPVENENGGGGLRNDGHKRFCRSFRMFISFVIILIATYDCFFLTTRIINNWGQEQNIMSIVMLTWGFQVTFSMGFLIYWQYTGYINELFKSLHMPNESKIYAATRRTILKTIVFSIFVFFCCLIAFSAALLLYYFYPNDLASVDLESLNFLQHSYMFPVSLGFQFYGFFIWNVVLTFYVIISIVAYAELTKYNEELQLIGRDNDHPDIICEELLEKFMKHIEYGRMIRTIDSTFEVYTFVMIGTNIPTTIFSLLSFFKALSGEWATLVLIVPGVFFCFVELVGLTAVPAKLHEAVGRVENIIYSNTRIWYPYDERIYQIAYALVTHVRQANLGISLWGFAVVSKPLILTTISLTATYLTLMLQLNPTVTHHHHFLNVTASSV